MSRASDEATVKAVHVFLCALGVGVGIMFLFSLPELKRYIKISSM
jgi:hypothetical protein